MVFFETSNSSSKLGLSVAPGWWLYPTVTLPLTLLVFLVWNVWRSRREAKQLQELHVPGFTDLAAPHPMQGSPAREHDQWQWHTQEFPHPSSEKYPPDPIHNSDKTSSSKLSLDLSFNGKHVRPIRRYEKPSDAEGCEASSVPISQPFDGSEEKWDSHRGSVPIHSPSLVLGEQSALVGDETIPAQSSPAPWHETSGAWRGGRGGGAASEGTSKARARLAQIFHLQPGITLDQFRDMERNLQHGFHPWDPGVGRTLKGRRVQKAHSIESLRPNTPIFKGERC